MSTNIVRSNKIISAVSTAASGTSASYPEAGFSFKENGSPSTYALQVVVTGSGTATIGYKCSSNGTDFYKPSLAASASTALVVAAGLTASGGPDSDGKYYFSISAPVCDSIKFYVTETGASSAVIVTATLCFQ